MGKFIQPLKSHLELDDMTEMTFPCEITIKIFGMASDEFEISALSIILRHVSGLRENAISDRRSAEGKYLALSVTVAIQDREQIDSIYRDLTADPHILMAL